MHIQLWSYNYDPEPTGIGPVSKTLAEGLRDRGHRVEVVAAHPHYPTKAWGRRMRPYRDERNGIPVLRLPLWIGRGSAMERYRQELTFMTAQFAALPVLGSPDIVVSTSPSFPALLPALVNKRLRGVPWLLWLQDILPDGAASTGIVKAGLIMDMARRLEKAAYREADRIVVLSDSFTKNLAAKGVPRSKTEVIHNPTTRVPRLPPVVHADGAMRVISMGNIGFSQGLAPLIEAYEASTAIEEKNIPLVLTGKGVGAAEVRTKVRSGRVRMLGILEDERLEEELASASVGLVSQQYEGAEFNIPSKLMNFMAYGIPVLAAVNPGGEVARIVREAEAGWVVDSSDPALFPRKVAELADARDEVARRGEAARAYAERHFSRAGFTERFERSLVQTCDQARQD